MITIKHMMCFFPPQRPVGALIEGAETEPEAHAFYQKVPGLLIRTHVVLQTFYWLLLLLLNHERRRSVDGLKSFQQAAADESGEHHFRKPANDITSQLEINFGDLGRPSRGRGGARGGRGGRGGGGSRTARGGGRSEKVTTKTVYLSRM